MSLLVFPATTIRLAEGTVHLTVHNLEHPECPRTIDYRGPDGADRRFDADEVALATTPMGDWYTVTVAVDEPEQGWQIVLSVLIPTIGVQPGHHPTEAVSTVGVECRQPVEAFPPGPQVGTFRTLRLEGEASRS